jgi:predicted 3-demethylubiquinone-9 3-methyltransferase (glyoxalase superfamily)
MPTLQRITPCLWFDHQAEDAAKHYVAIFPNSRITSVTRYPDEGTEITGGKPGSVMVVAFELDGHTMTGLNGGPHFTFNEAVSLQVNCDTQEEIDHYWMRLGEGGDPKAQQCGWLKDRFGLSWQVVPRGMEDIMREENSPGAKRAFAAMLTMKKMDLAALQRAYDGAA